MSVLEIIAGALGLLAAIKLLDALNTAGWVEKHDDDGPDAPPPPPSGA
ncbi:MAG: hypothetical protein M1541_04545 [Acidobacteria bacterium]|nr:hypothetical protein [Acidobacteriota bacterium]